MRTVRIRWRNCSSINFANGSVVKVINVYFPRQSSDGHYGVDLRHCLGFIDNTMCRADLFSLVGDCSFDCTDNAGQAVAVSN
jgi:hypothetical protein